jgi:hypothetical protein
MGGPFLSASAHDRADSKREQRGKFEPATQYQHALTALIIKNKAGED